MQISENINGSDQNFKFIKSIFFIEKFLFSLLKGLSHIHGSHHGSSRILIRGIPARNNTVTVFLLRFKFFKGAFTHSRIVTRTIPGHCSGIIRVVSGISVIKKFNLRNFPSREYHSWQAPCSFRVATGTVLRPASSGCKVPGCTRWLREGTRCLPGVIQIIFHPCTPGWKTKFFPGYAGAPRITPDACPVFYTMMPETTRMIPEQ